jgi:hypothetical protein
MDYPLFHSLSFIDTVCMYMYVTHTGVDQFNLFNNSWPGIIMEYRMHGPITWTSKILLVHDRVYVRSTYILWSESLEIFRHTLLVYHVYLK